jgi:phosphoglycolate phosphatase
MKRRYDLIVFDWDGTLVDSEARILSCFRAASRDTGIAYPGDDAVRDIIGLSMREAVEAIYHNLPAGGAGALIERYREHFVHLDPTPMPYFPGVQDALPELVEQGYRLAVATGKARRGLARMLDGSPMAQLFAVTRCADETLSKPHPQMLFDILKATGTAPQRALMVGDTVHDLRMAASAGTDALAVSYGVQPRARLLAESPLACVDSFSEVCGWLDECRRAG